MVTPTIPRKRCSAKSKCLHPVNEDGWLPATFEYFHRKRDSPDGLNNKCKRCNAAASKAWKDARPGYEKAYLKYYRETHKDDLRVWRQNYHARHRDRHLREFAEYQSRHADRLKTRRHLHYLQNASRIIVANRQRKVRRKQSLGAYTLQDVQVMLQSQKGLCWWCGVSVGEVYHVDHRVPLSRGGTNYPENLCISCPNCNLSKHNKLPQEWNGRLL